MGVESKGGRLRSKILHQASAGAVVGVPVLSSAGRLSNPWEMLVTQELTTGAGNREAVNHSISASKEVVEESKSEMPAEDPASPIVELNSLEPVPNSPGVESDLCADG